MKNLKEQMIEITESKGVCNAIEFAFTHSKMSKEHTSKPVRLSVIHTPEEAATYAKNLQDYQQKVIEINDINREIEKTNEEIVSIVERFIIDASGLNSIPEQYRDKVYSYAYSEGRSLGFCEVYRKLLKLIEIFN